MINNHRHMQNIGYFMKGGYCDYRASKAINDNKQEKSGIQKKPGAKKRLKTLNS